MYIYTLYIYMYMYTLYIYIYIYIKTATIFCQRLILADTAGEGGHCQGQGSLQFRVEGLGV